MEFPYQDQRLKCRECGNEFIFTAGEQAFYAEKGLQNQPQRCPTCRANRRRERASGTGPIREMYPIVCASCGIETTVPFVPRNNRPVYCSKCYDRVRSGSAATVS